MQPYLTEETKEMPRIQMDPNGQLEISGRSLPENAARFYGPAIDWARRYAEQPAPTTILNLKLEYLNSASTLMLLRILDVLVGIQAQGHAVEAVWYYVRGDDLMEDKGRELAAIVDLPLEVKTYG